MNVSNRNHPYLRASDQRIGAESASIASVLVLAICFAMSMLGKLFESGLLGNVVQAGAMGGLIVFSLFCPKQFSLRSIPPSFRASLIAIVLITLMLGLLGYFGGFAPRNLRFSVLLKSSGTILTVCAIVFSAPAFTYREIVRGLILFAVIEISVCVALFYGGTDINANALAVRISVGAMILFSLADVKILRITGLVVCIGFSLLLQCRTSICAFLGAMAFMFVERRSRKNRALVLLSIIAGTVIVWTMLPLIISTLQSIAVANLGSDNFVAKFFLDDKSASKIQTDMLDRNHVWEYSWEFICKRPWLGYGLGTENAIMGARSHNAFLSMVFEGGIVNLFAWVWFYYLSLVRLFNRRLLKRTGDLPLFYLSNLLIGYMLLAGMVETSGLASVSTPINLIFMFLMVWLFSPRPRIRSLSA